MDDPLVQKIVKTIADALRPTKIILFGSRARGNAGPDSDVDLLVIYDGDLPKREVRLQIQQLFPRRDFSMDVFVLNSDEFERQQKLVSTVGRVAACEGVVCYG